MRVTRMVMVIIIMRMAVVVPGGSFAESTVGMRVIVICEVSFFSLLV